LEIFFEKKIFLLKRMEVSDLVKFAKECQGVLDLDTPSLIRVSGQLAVKVNAIQNLSGQEKQKLICQILKTLISEKLGDSERAVSLKKVVDDVIPASLDLALAAARGKLDLKKVKMSVWVKYFSCCARSVVNLLVSNNVISQEQAKQADSALNAVEEKVLAGCEGPANKAFADAKDAEAAAEEKKEEETFEKKNPMHETKSESATQESKAEETQKTE
jgi:hypothetical protein